MGLTRAERLQKSEASVATIRTGLRLSRKFERKVRRGRGLSLFDSTKGAHTDPRLSLHNRAGGLRSLGRYPPYVGARTNAA